MKFNYNVLLIFWTIALLGCEPRYPGIDLTPAPVAWRVQFDKEFNSLTSNFDTNSNAYILYSYREPAATQNSYAVVKVDASGTEVWRTTGLAKLANPLNLEHTRILFDSLNNLYVVGKHRDSEFVDTVFSAKILNSGEISWQDAYAVPATITRADLSYLMQVISSTGNLYISYVNENVSVHTLAYDAIGTSSEIYNFDHAPAERTIINFKIAADDSLILYHESYSSTSPLIYKNRQLVQFSGNGQIMQDLAYTDPVRDFIVNPDGSIYIITIVNSGTFNVKRSQLNGVIDWEKDYAFHPNVICTGKPAAIQYRSTLLSSDATLNIMFNLKSCVDDETLGYEIVRLDSLGQEQGRITQELPEVRLYAPLRVDITLFGTVGFQLDELNNLIVSEFYNSFAIAWPLIPILYKPVLITKKYDPTGALVSEVFTDAKGFSVSGPYYTLVNATSDGSLLVVGNDGLGIIKHANVF